jgi:hypothetical protein
MIGDYTRSKPSGGGCSADITCSLASISGAGSEGVLCVMLLTIILITINVNIQITDR